MRRPRAGDYGSAFILKGMLIRLPSRFAGGLRGVRLFAFFKTAVFEILGITTNRRNI